MKLNKFDIGGEIISILTKGMYPDPKDALREYIQNGVDAKAKDINLKIRQQSIVIEDNGKGMNHDIMRKALRVGISEKTPSKNVGFMGIGIYSSFHLCDKLVIFSRGSDNIPNKLEMDFGGMRVALEEQKEKRLRGIAKPEELIDLQTLLEQYISLTKNGELSDSDFPSKGTRVEMTNLEIEFYSALSDFSSVAEYLRNVIPLHFDKENFKFAEKIEHEISTICKEHNQKFELINLFLQINSESNNLYRPYTNYSFNKNGILPLSPKFYTISNGEFFGVAWGCLNSVRKKVETKSLRGFILKKQGFSIGSRESMVKYFQRGNTFFDRYSGEIIIVNPKLIPNASRTELEYSPLRTVFYENLLSVTKKFDAFAHKYQEHSKGDAELSDLREEIKLEIGNYNENEGDPEILLNKIKIIFKIIEKLKTRISNKGFSPDSENIAKSLLKEATNLEEIYKERLKNLNKDKKTKQESKKKSTSQIAKKLSKIRIREISDKQNYESLYDLLKDLEFEINEELFEVISIIDEMFIQKDAGSKSEYYALLNELKSEILNTAN